MSTQACGEIKIRHPDTVNKGGHFWPSSHQNIAQKKLGDYESKNTRKLKEVGCGTQK